MITRAVILSGAVIVGGLAVSQLDGSALCRHYLDSMNDDPMSSFGREETETKRRRREDSRYWEELDRGKKA